MSDNSKKTVIESGTEFEGSIRSECGITLSGKAKGKLSAPSLTVTSSGTVSGQVKVQRLESEGEISGEIEAQAVQLSGKVSDDTVIKAKTLEVKLEQPDGGLRVAFGNCKLQVGENVGGSKDRAKSEEKRQHEPSRI